MFIYNILIINRKAVFASNYLKKRAIFEKNDLNLQKFFLEQKIIINLNYTIMSEIKEKVVSIIVDKLGVNPEDVVETASFTNDLGADSLDTVELIMEFEKEFNVTIPDDQAEKISTVGDAMKFIEENIG